MAEASFKWPGWCLRLAKSCVTLHGLPWDYDPRPFLDKIEVPMLWLLGGEDRQAPNHETIARLDGFKKKGKPFDVVVLPGTVIATAPATHAGARRHGAVSPRAVRPS